MHLFSQRELFRASNGSAQKFGPGRVPHLTPGMRRVMTAIMAGGSLKGLQYHGGYLTRSLKRLISEGCVKVRAGHPAALVVTRLGEIAWRIK